MSLINDALKKAQRARSTDAGDLAPPTTGGGRIAKRGQPLSAKSIVLYSSGVLVLFVIAVVATVYVLNRPETRPVAAQKPVAPAVITPETSGPLIVPPVVNSPAAPPVTPVPIVSEKSPPPGASPAPSQPTEPATASSTQAAAPTATAPSPTSAPATPEKATAGTAPAKPETSPAPAAIPPAPAMPDERIHRYLDALRVTAVRLQSPSESRVMMNDRVYRVNDIVERSLSLRLTKVESGQLTFTDANGVSYVKYL
jgi:hypothetical protein